MRGGARHHHQSIPGKGKQLLEFAAADRGLRQYPRDRVPALAVRQPPAPLLQRQRAAQQRLGPHHPLFHHRGWRLRRLRPGRRMVRGWPRPQLGLQSGLQGSRPVDLRIGERKKAPDSGAFIFVLEMFRLFARLRVHVAHALPRACMSFRGCAAMFGSKSISRWLVAFGLSLTAALAAATTSAPAQDRRQNTPGQFDFYVLALSWSPSFCEGREDNGGGGRSQQIQCGGRPFSFVVHGLWPQYERGFPEYCDRDSWLDRNIMTSMLDLMPAPGLIFNEWKNNGT